MAEGTQQIYVIMINEYSDRGVLAVMAGPIGADIDELFSVFKTETYHPVRPVEKHMIHVGMQESIDRKARMEHYRQHRIAWLRRYQQEYDLSDNADTGDVFVAWLVRRGFRSVGFEVVELGYVD